MKRNWGLSIHYPSLLILSLALLAGCDMPAFSSIQIQRPDANPNSPEDPDDPQDPSDPQDPGDQDPPTNPDPTPPVPAALPKFSFNLANQTVAENVGSLSVAVKVNAAATAPLSVAYVVEGTAAYPADHNLQAGVLNFAAGETSRSINFQILTDTVTESTETVVIRLVAASGIELIAPATHTVSITNVAPPVSAATTFTDQTNLNATTSTVTTFAISNAIRAEGLSGSATASVSGQGSPVILKNGVESGASVSVTASDRLAIKLTTADATNTERLATLRVGTGFERNFKARTTSTSGGLGNRRYRAVWYRDPSTTVALVWEALASSTRSRVYYDTVDHGTDISKYANSKDVNVSGNAAETTDVSYKAMRNVSVLLTGLSPATVYYFVISDSGGTSSRMWLRTIPSHSAERLAIIEGGDSRNNATARRGANRLVAKLRPHVVFFGGDYVDTQSDSEWQEWMDDWQLTIAADGRVTPIVPIRGNHENDANVMKHLFALKQTYFFQNFGGSLLRLYALDTETSMSSTGTQTQTFLQDLDSTVSTSSRWRLASYHRPMRPHNSGKGDGNTQYGSWAMPFYNYGVQLVMESDSHLVKSTFPVKPYTGSGSDEGFVEDRTRGTVYIGEGGWGAPLRSANDNKDWTRDSGSFNHIHWMFVDSDKIEIRTIKVDQSSAAPSLTNPFDVPADNSVALWDAPNTGKVLTIEHHD